MSRNMLIVVSVVTVLLAALITPTAATPPRVDRAAHIAATLQLGPGSGPSLLLPVIQPNGGCEGGGGGGCPV